MENSSFITPARVLFTSTFFVQFVPDLYALRNLEVSPLFEIMSRLAVIWAIWWWLRDDSRRLGITWVMDLGMFLLIAWPLILPWHLFKTRGLKAFIPILAFILTILCGTVAAIAVSALLG